MRAYQSFIRDAGKPIGWTVSIVTVFGFIIWALGAMCATDPEAQARRDAERTWNSTCERLGVGETFDTEVDKMSGKRYCVKVTLIEDYPLFDENSWRRGCRELGGEWKYYNHAKACFNVEVIDSLGAREDVLK